MTTLKDALETLEHVKQKLASERAVWREKEAKLIEEVRKAKAAKREVQAEVEEAEAGPTPEEIRSAALDEAEGVVEECHFRHRREADAWGSKDRDERGAASQTERMWAHPFTGAAIGVVGLKLKELRG
jgi:hypothetical protein